jgi:aminoglycoside 3'-phosphotransferase-2
VRPDVPECLHHFVASYAFERAPLGQAAETYRLVGSDRPTRYLKIAPDLEREHERLRWAAELIPVPRPVAFAKHAQRDYLLLDELPGTPVAIATCISVADRVVHVARTLRELHTMSASSCPFDARVETRLVDAEANVRAGLVDESDFDAERIGRSAQAVLDELRAWPAFAEDLVVTHGDFTLSNILVHPTGMLDLGRLGVADRHQDIALALRDIEADFGSSWRDVFLREYGIAALDTSKLSFFRLLDELF